VIYAVNMGGINHVAGIVLEKSAPGAKFRFAQVGAGAKCFAAIKGGHAQVGAFSGPEIVLYGQQGLRALATIAKQRDPNYPNMPSASELGYDAVFETVQMWFAPKGTHADRLNFLADTLEKAMRTDEFRKKIEEFKMGATFMRGKALRDYLESEYAKLVKILPKDK
jgi:tripartite-type tricarboxylate transporter receptor subunit TctC